MLMKPLMAHPDMRRAAQAGGDGGEAAPPKPLYVIDQNILAAMVGLAACSLPAIMYLGRRVFDRCDYDSISHFYYTPFFGDFFVGVLVFIGVFMTIYRVDSEFESRLANFAGLCAFTVALCPTEGSGCDRAAFSGRAFVTLATEGRNLAAITDPAALPGHFQLIPHADWVHGSAAALLFLFLTYYCLVVFPRVDPVTHCRGGVRHGGMTGVKKARNGVYYLSGAVMLASLVMLLVGVAGPKLGFDWPGWDRNNLTFWAESAALIAFGASWLVRGRFGNLAMRD